MYVDYWPDEKCGGDQHHSEVHSDGGLEVESLEVGGGVADTEEEEGREVGRHQLIDESPLELHLHLYTLVSSLRCVSIFTDLIIIQYDLLQNNILILVSTWSFIILLKDHIDNRNLDCHHL